MENYQEYKDFVLNCPGSNDCKVCKEKGFNTGSVPGYFAYQHVKLLFVLPAPSQEDVDSGIAFTSKTGKRLLKLIEDAGLYGNNSIGFTYLVHCPVSGFTKLKGAFKDCKRHFENEIKITNDVSFVLCGYDVAKILLPSSMIPEKKGSMLYTIVGDDVNLFGKHYFFLPNIEDLFDNKDNINSKPEYGLCVESIIKASEILNI